jgi:glycosyltransferase involved in cell wall biosynthesis
MNSSILILVPNDSLGGAEQHLMNIAQYYLDRGSYVEVRFLTKERTKAWRKLKGNFCLIFTNASSEKGGIYYFLKDLVFNKFKEYNYLFTSHVHLTGVAGLLIKLKILTISKFVGRESTSIFKRFSGAKLALFKVLYKVGYDKLDLLICQTDFMKEQLVSALPKLSSKINIQVIPNPINLENIESQNFDQNFKDVNFIVSAGRLIPEKGFDVLINAFAIVKKDNLNLKLLILGDGVLKNDLQKLSSNLGIAEDIHFLGFRDNVYPYFKHANACVVSSRIEGFPNVLLQMMSQNDKIISTLCAGGISDIPCIYTCVTENHKALAFKINEAINAVTVQNRLVFNNFLENRSLNNFVKKVNLYLNA